MTRLCPKLGSLHADLTPPNVHSRKHTRYLDNAKINKNNKTVCALGRSLSKAKKRATNPVKPLKLDKKFKKFYNLLLKKAISRRSKKGKSSKYVRIY